MAIDKVKDLIKNLLDTNCVDHIFLKGSTTKNFYPDKTIRSLGDIDILIKPSDEKKVVRLLKANNFEYRERCSHHISFHYKNFRRDSISSGVKYRYSPRESDASNVKLPIRTRFRYKTGFPQ